MFLFTVVHHLRGYERIASSLSSRLKKKSLSRIISTIESANSSPVCITLLSGWVTKASLKKPAVITSVGNATTPHRCKNQRHDEQVETGLQTVGAIGMPGKLLQNSSEIACANRMLPSIKKSIIKILSRDDQHLLDAGHLKRSTWLKKAHRYYFFLKLATTERACVMVTVQVVTLVVQAPDQLPNFAPLPAVAVKVTLLPAVNSAVHCVPQFMPSG